MARPSPESPARFRRQRRDVALQAFGWFVPLYFGGSAVAFGGVPSEHATTGTVAVAALAVLAAATLARQLRRRLTISPDGVLTADGVTGRSQVDLDRLVDVRLDPDTPQYEHARLGHRRGARRVPKLRLTDADGDTVQVPAYDYWTPSFELFGALQAAGHRAGAAVSPSAEAALRYLTGAPDASPRRTTD
jgi:hypothetical protein